MPCFLGHLDDFYLQGRTYQQCVSNIVDTIQLFTKLGSIYHPNKCNFIPSQSLVILGFVLNSHKLTIKLTAEKATKLKQTCQALLRAKFPTIREVARVVGKLVSSFPGVMHAPLYYRMLGRDTTLALKQSKGNFDSVMTLSQPARSEYTWWMNNIESTYNVISHGPPVQLMPP